MSLADIFKGMQPKNAANPFAIAPSPSYNIFNPSPAPSPLGPYVPTTQVTRTLPNGQGTYQSPVISQPSAPAPLPKVAPVVQPPAAPTAPAAPAGVDYSRYTDPATGKVLSPQEYANMLATRVTGGSIPNYAGNSLTQGPQTTAQLTSTATDLNNQRNDIAVGAADPYGVASKSGIAYSPTDLMAIEKAYAGIYDPALKDVFAKLDKKQKEDASALDLKNQLSLQAQKHRDDIELKGSPTAAEKAAAGGTGTYVVGANPTVDAFVTGLQNGTYKPTDIPAMYKGMVAQGMLASGNQADGKPTTTEIGLQTLDAATRLMEMFNAGKGTSTVGQSRLFGGGIATPGSDSSNFINLFNTLIANKSLEGVKFLKGQGQVSDAERLLLKNAMSELNLSQGEAEFKKSLQRIIDKLSGGASASNVVTAPDGTPVEITD